MERLGSGCKTAAVSPGCLRPAVLCEARAEAGAGPGQAAREWLRLEEVGISLGLLLLKGRRESRSGCRKVGGGVRQAQQCPLPAAPAPSTAARLLRTPGRGGSPWAGGGRPCGQWCPACPVPYAGPETWSPGLGEAKHPSAASRAEPLSRGRPRAMALTFLRNGSWETGRWEAQC